MDTITQVTRCITEGRTYQEDWEKTYESHVWKALYGKNFKEADGKKKVRYNLLCEVAKIWSNITQKSLMHKMGSKEYVSNLHKFVLFHLMDEISLLRDMKTSRGEDDILYVALINQFL